MKEITIKNVDAAIKKTLAKKQATVNRIAKRKTPVAEAPSWYITHVFGSHMEIFGLANDQRIYRWNTRSALWVLHKEGLSPETSN